MENETFAEHMDSPISQIKGFLTKDLLGIFRIMYSRPVDGLIPYWQAPPPSIRLQVAAVYIMVFLIFGMGVFLLAGEMREYLNFSYYLNLSLFPLFIMLLVSAITMGIKALMGKGDLNRELLTGALVGIPLTLLVPGLFIVRVLMPGNVLTMLMNPGSGGLLGLLLLLYTFLMLVSIVFQSLKSAEVNATLAWYVSPAVVGMAFYIASRLVVMIS